MSAKKAGTVIWFNEKKGFGYAKDAAGHLIYVHYSAINSPEKFKTLKTGQQIAISFEDDGDRLRATSVNPLEANG